MILTRDRQAQLTQSCLCISSNRSSPMALPSSSHKRMPCLQRNGARKARKANGQTPMDHAHAALRQQICTDLAAIGQWPLVHWPSLRFSVASSRDPVLSWFPNQIHRGNTETWRGFPLPLTWQWLRAQQEGRSTWCSLPRARSISHRFVPFLGLSLDGTLEDGIKKARSGWRKETRLSMAEICWQAVFGQINTCGG